MQIGVMPSLGENSLGGEPPEGRTPRFADILAQAQAAERLGFDSFWLADHLIYRFPNEPEVGCWEVFTFLSGVAAATSRIQLGPLVACVSFRNQALLAKMADSLDEISNGRFILGLGAGWHKPEYDAFGYPFDHLASRFEEALQIIAPLLHEGKVDFHGQYYEAPNTVLRPRGPTARGPRMWIGSHRPRMLELTARYADAWNTVWHKHAAGVEKVYPDMLAACEKVGRDPATLELTAGTLVHVLAPGEQPPAVEEGKDPGIVGEPEAVAEELRAFAAVGVKHLVCQFTPDGVEGIERFAQVLPLLDDK